MLIYETEVDLTPHIAEVGHMATEQEAKRWQRALDSLIESKGLVYTSTSIEPLPGKGFFVMARNPIGPPVFVSKGALADYALEYEMDMAAQEAEIGDYS